MQSQESLLLEDEEIEDFNILNLSCLAYCIDSLVGTKELKIKGTINEITEIRAAIDCAAELMMEYDRAKDEDLKHEFGYQLSELFAEIEEQLEESNRFGTNLYIH